MIEIINWMRSPQWDMLEICVFCLVILSGLLWILSMFFQNKVSEAEKAFLAGDHAKALSLCKSDAECLRLGKLAQQKAMQAKRGTPESQLWWETAAAYFKQGTEIIDK